MYLACHVAGQLKLTSQMTTLGTGTSLIWQTFCPEQSKSFCGRFGLALQVPDQAEEHWNQAKWRGSQRPPPGRGVPGPVGMTERSSLWGSLGVVNDLGGPRHQCQ